MIGYTKAYPKKNGRFTDANRPYGFLAVRSPGEGAIYIHLSAPGVCK